MLNYYNKGTFKAYCSKDNTVLFIRFFLKSGEQYLGGHKNKVLDQQFNYAI